MTGRNDEYQKVLPQFWLLNRQKVCWSKGQQDKNRQQLRFRCQTDNGAIVQDKKTRQLPVNFATAFVAAPPESVLVQDLGGNSRPFLSRQLLCSQPLCAHAPRVISNCQLFSSLTDPSTSAADRISTSRKLNQGDSQCIVCDTVHCVVRGAI